MAEWLRCLSVIAALPFGTGTCGGSLNRDLWDEWDVWDGMKSLRFFLLISCAFVIFSCAFATPKYQPSGLFSSRWDRPSYYYGYSEVQIDSTSYQVTFTGDSPDGNDRFSLYHAAELTDTHGFDYFIVTNPRTNDGSATKTIRMYKGNTPTDNPSAYNAKSMLSVMGPTIQR
jgi:hypothetical protein